MRCQVLHRVVDQTPFYLRNWTVVGDFPVFLGQAVLQEYLEYSEVSLLVLEDLGFSEDDSHPITLVDDEGSVVVDAQGVAVAYQFLDAFRMLDFSGHICGLYDKVTGFCLSCHRIRMSKIFLDLAICD